MKNLKLLIIVSSLILPIKSANSTSFKQANNSFINVEHDYSEVYDNVIDGVVSCLQYTQVKNGLSSTKTLSSIGSGFVFKENNEGYYIMTNNHVIAPVSIKDKIEMHILTSSNEEINTVKIVGHDKYQDLAVLYVEKQNIHSPIKVLEVDKNLPSPGDNCFAIGNPASISFKGTLTVGIVSGIKRMISNENDKIFYQDHVIQVDCPINSGNSGGPLFNDDGKVIAINTSKFLEKYTLKYEGLAFSLPIHDMIYLANRIIDSNSQEDISITTRFGVDNSINCQYMSLSHTDLSFRNSHGYNNLTKGVIILGTSNIYEASPYSVITKINNISIDNVYDFRSILFEYDSLENISISYLPFNGNSLGEEITKNVQLKELSFVEEVEE